MNTDTLAFLRDLSLVLLCLLTFVLMVVPLVILFFAQKYLRLGRRKLRVPLLYGQLWAIRAENLTYKAAGDVIQVPIKLNEGVARAEGTVRGFLRRRPQRKS